MRERKDDAAGRIAISVLQRGEKSPAWEKNGSSSELALAGRKSTAGPQFALATCYHDPIPFNLREFPQPCIFTVAGNDGSLARLLG